jgi:riboflavin synthase
LREPGDTVNLEADVVAKYVERLAAGYVGGDHPAAAVTVGKEVRAR